MKSAITLSLLVLALAACRETTETHTTAGETSTVSTTTTQTETVSIDTQAVGTAIDRAQEVAKDAAQKTGTALETAGEAVEKKVDDAMDDDDDKKKKDDEKKPPPPQP